MPERVLFCARLVVYLCASFSQSITTDAGAVDVVLIWVDLGRDPEVVKCLQSQVMTKSGQALLRKRDRSPSQICLSNVARGIRPGTSSVTTQACGDRPRSKRPGSCSGCRDQARAAEESSHICTLLLLVQGQRLDPAATTGYCSVIMRTLGRAAPTPVRGHPGRPAEFRIVAHLSAQAACGHSSRSSPSQEEGTWRDWLASPGTPAGHEVG